MNDTALTKIKDIVINSDHAVFFGGAGVSTESGIPDFRGKDGLYSENPEYLLSLTCLKREPERFFKFYRGMLYPDVLPNAAHTALAELEKRGIIKAVITQNIDGLHQKAGSKNVLELHGTTLRYHCCSCNKAFTFEYFTAQSDSVPRCDACGGIVRPDIVLYEEPLDDDVFERAEREVREADVMIVGGSSLVVNPAAWLVRRFGGKHLIIINYSETPYDAFAEFVIRDSVGKVLGEIAK